MIQKLRRQFILVAMCSTLAVLTIIVGAMNVINYYSTAKRADDLLQILADNNGRFFLFDQRRNADDVPMVPPDENFQPGKGMQEFRNDFRKNFSRETEYETRFFSVTMESDGTVSSSDLGMIASVEEEQAGQYAKTVFKKYQKSSSVKGYLDEYRYVITQKGEGYLIIFVDCASYLKSVRKVLLVSVAMSGIGLLAVFALVLFFSKKVFKPVEATYRKQKRFITDASHELKTPLTIISANMEVMEMESEESQWSKSIKKQVERLVGLVEQMVTLSRLDEQQETHHERFSLSDAVRDTADIYLPVAESQGKEFQVSIAENLYVTGDEKQIRQMVGLLLDNAMKYAAVKSRDTDENCKERPRIKLTLSAKGKKGELRLWNTTDQDFQGNQDALFERFYRPDNARNSKKGGSGIGLSIVKSIVEAHHGKITANGREDGSIEFKAILPINQT